MAFTASTKIGFLVPGWPLQEAPNGIVSYVANLRAGLADLGTSSLVVAPRETRPGESDVVGVLPSQSVVGRAKRLLLRKMGVADSHVTDWIRALRHEMGVQRERGLGIFELEESFGWAQKLRVPGVTNVVRLHGPWFLNGDVLGVKRDAEYEARVKEEGVAIAQAAAVTSPSADVLEQVRKFYGLELPRARVVPNPGSFVSADAAWNAEKARPRQILFVGRFDRHKGGDLVLDAFPRIAARYADAELVFAGPDRGFRDDGGRIWSLDEYVSQRIPAEIRGRVRLLGQTKPERIEELRRESAISIVASRYENFPMVAVEALAFGCPVVAANAGGIPEIVTHERTGLMFRPGDAQDLAEQVLRFLAEPQFASACAAAARKEYEARFSPSVVAGQMLDFYRSIPADQRAD